MHRFTIHADGGSRGNPGPSGAGAVVEDAHGKVITEVSEYLGTRTNNYAEYEAVILAFGALAKHLKQEVSGAEIIVKMDSELVVKQMKGLYKVKHPGLKAQYARLLAAMEPFGRVTFTHVYREDNAAADTLANAAMDRGA